jgi:hypothetical protein
LPETLEQRFGDLQLAYPATWEAEHFSDMNRLLLVDPQIEMDWQANVLLELLRDDERRPLEVAMADLCEAQEEEHAGFHLRRQEIREHITGGPFGLIEFDSLTDGMALTQWLAILATSGSERLFVTATSERSLWTKYEPLFEAVVSSIRHARS